MSLKTRRFRLYFCCRKFRYIFNHFYAVRVERRQTDGRQQFTFAKNDICAVLQWSKKPCILACKRDPMVRDRDIWFSVRDEIETFPRFHETETFGNYVSRPRLHPWLIYRPAFCADEETRRYFIHWPSPAGLDSWRGAHPARHLDISVRVEGYKHVFIQSLSTAETPNSP